MIKARIDVSESTEKRLRTPVWEVEVTDPWCEYILHIPSTSSRHSSLQGSHPDFLVNKQAGDGKVISEHELANEAIREGGVVCFLRN